MNSLSHMATALVDAPADVVFDFLSDPLKLGNWALGSFATEPTATPGVYKGRSLFDGAVGALHIESDPAHLSILYFVGTETKRFPRIAARVVPGPACGLAEDECYASLLAWRTASMDNARWDRLCKSHEVEILMIAGQIAATRVSRG